MKKRIYLIALVALLTVQMFGTLVIVAEANADGDLSPEEGAIVNVESLEEEEFGIQPMGDPDNVHYVLDVPVFQQSNSYYCGPATVKQVLWIRSRTYDDQ